MGEGYDNEDDECLENNHIQKRLIFSIKSIQMNCLSIVCVTMIYDKILEMG